MGHPVISVILPFFNAEASLDRAIESLLHQTLEDFELILVDDGSTDSSAAMARQALTDPRVRLLHIDHGGVVPASMAGLAGSHGQLIARMDADDVSLPRRLELQKAFLDVHLDIEVVGSKVSYVGLAENEGFRAYVDWSNSITTPEEIARQRFVEMPVVNPSLMFRKSVIDRLGWYESGDFPEDYELVLRYLASNVRFGKVPETLLEWHDSPQRLTRTNPRYSTDAFYVAKSQYLARWLAQHNPHHPKVWIWGGGKLSRKRSSLLVPLGVEIAGYIDVKARQLESPCVLFGDLPDHPDRFVLSYVGNRGKREEVRAFLEGRRYVDGRDFLIIS